MDQESLKQDVERVRSIRRLLASIMDKHRTSTRPEPKDASNVKPTSHQPPDKKTRMLLGDPLPLTPDNSRAPLPKLGVWGSETRSRKGFSGKPDKRPLSGVSKKYGLSQDSPIPMTSLRTFDIRSGTRVSSLRDRENGLEKEVNSRENPRDPEEIEPDSSKDRKPRLELSRLRLLHNVYVQFLICGSIGLALILLVYEHTKQQSFEEPTPYEDFYYYY